MRAGSLNCPATSPRCASDQPPLSHSAVMIMLFTHRYVTTGPLFLPLGVIFPPLGSRLPTRSPGDLSTCWRRLAVCRHAPTHPGDVSTCWRRVAWVSEAATGFRLSSLSSVPPYPVLTIGRETLGSTQNDLVCKVGDWSIALAYVDASQLYRYGIAWL